MAPVEPMPVSVQTPVNKEPAHPAITSRITFAKLPALPPDPNQVITRSDLARNHDALTSGYDRFTLKSLERKEASISFLRGSF
jgi:hypothetical protein